MENVKLLLFAQGIHWAKVGIASCGPHLEDAILNDVQGHIEGADTRDIGVASCKLTAAQPLRAEGSIHMVPGSLILGGIAD